MPHDDIDRAHRRFQNLFVRLELMGTMISCCGCRATIEPLEVAAFLGPHPERGVSMKQVLCMLCLRERPPPTHVVGEE
jgi:hypothetical protein